MQQVVDLQQDKRFKDLGVEVISIAPDPLPAIKADVQQLGIRTPFLSDSGNKVAQAYDVMRWAAATGEPGHTFVLIDKTGRIRWVKDYGAPENGGLMYVKVDELYAAVSSRLGVNRS